MSRHIHMSTMSNGLPVEIAAGYDRPLKTFFLQIFLSTERSDIQESDEDEGEGGEETLLYDNSFDKNLPPLQPASWDYFDNILEQKGIKMPEAMREQILADEHDPAAGGTYRCWE